ncbi:MAG: epoxyqueuosine reductase QueH [Treponema sp.]|jgi:tRNA A37 threonylcarbamoyladenosine dehydratase/predicted adenine nucleotide alpha hydrolase (AANH) superfamily ATPase|nr:epoxyqueuosine reductase QueH [Treponema sp.]
MRLLFHCCCGPCATASVESLLAEQITPTLFWYNPNIHPLTEYRSRRDSLAAFSSDQKLPLLMIDEYGLDLFLHSVDRVTETPERCRVCYLLRLEKTAAYAAEHGFDAFSTSLLISPYQQHETIQRIGGEMAARYGIAFLYRDFRPLFRKGQTAARERGLYMQKYCGCIFSEKERYEKSMSGGIDDKIQNELPIRYANEQQSSVPDPQSPIPILFQRLALLVGTGALEKLKQTNVLIFGAGGVGSWCAEALVRSGLGRIGITDYDTVQASNVNRQVQATSRTIGSPKVEVLKRRLLEINPDCEVAVWAKPFTRESASEFGIEKADYAIDAIDTFPHKLDLIEYLFSAGVKFFSSMGMACKLDPTRIKAGSIWETKGCALAKLVRNGLRRRGFNGSFTVVYSDEPPLNAGQRTADYDEGDTADSSPAGKKKINGSSVTVTAPAGMALASLVLRDIAGQAGKSSMEKR